ncbi:MAG TPA: hypothetical protein V6D10_14385 [Trichocoleus sp.]|jgi:hypothetical protein
MTLSTGATLQNGKYLVQAILSRSDFGLTYRARHTYLDQTVILQSLNEVTQERSDFTQLRQQFATGARQLAKYPANHPLRALDYFEENGLPFVVLQFVAEQAPKLSDWFNLPLEPSTPTNGETPAAAPLSEAPRELLTSQPPLNETVRPEVTKQVVSPEPIFVSIPPIDSGAHPNPVVSTNGCAVSPSPRQKRRFASPSLLIVTALIGASVGAGMGLALRLQPKSQSGEAALDLRHGLFTREQSFPSESDWPISETPAPVAPPAQASERPNPSTNSAFSSGTFDAQPFPTQQYYPPASLNPAPALETPDSGTIAPPETQRKTQTQDSLPDPAIEKPLTSAPTIDTAPPIAQPRAVPVAPAPAPAPVAPPPAPVIEAPAPAAPAEAPIRKPRVIDQ